MTCSMWNASRATSSAARSRSRRLPSCAAARVRGTVSVAIVSDARVRALNRTYRRKDSATDVLSFPADARRIATAPPCPYLGDIVIARGIARRQARAAGHSVAAELRLLAL